MVDTIDLLRWWERDPQSLNTSLNRTHRGWAKIQTKDKINPDFPNILYILYIYEQWWTGLQATSV